MKTLAFTMRRLDPTDPLSVKFHQNDLGSFPTWNCDGPGTYVATFAHPIGFVPKQVRLSHGDVFRFVLIDQPSPNSFAVNFMLDDSNSLNADLADEFIVMNILDEATATAAAPLA